MNQENICIFDESSPGDPPFFSISLKSTNFSILNFLQFCTCFIVRHLELFGHIIHIRLPTVLKLPHCLTYSIRLSSENVGWIDLVFSGMIVQTDNNGGGGCGCLLFSFLNFACRLHLPTAAVLKWDMVLCRLCLLTKFGANLAPSAEEEKEKSKNSCEHSSEDEEEYVQILTVHL